MESNGTIVYNLQKHLVNLLFEEFVLRAYSMKFEESESSINTPESSNIWDIVVDIIGFPIDNTLDYDFNKKIHDDLYFCRDHLADDYYERTNSLAEEVEVFINYEGIKLVNEQQEPLIKSLLLGHIEWLYFEYDNFLINNNFK